MPWDQPLPKSRETNILLAMRAVANAFQENTPVGVGAWVAPVLLEIGKAPYDVLIKNHRVTLATLLFKYVIVIVGDIDLSTQRVLFSFPSLSCVRLKGPVAADINDAHLSLISVVSLSFICQILSV